MQKELATTRGELSELKSRKEQRCAHVDDEHSSKERVSCNKLFPRKLVEPGAEEVAEEVSKIINEELAKESDGKFIYSNQFAC